MNAIAVQAQQLRLITLALGFSLITALAGVWLVLGCWYPRLFWASSGVMVVGGYALIVHLGITALLILPWCSRKKANNQLASDVAFLLWIIVSASLCSLSVLASARPVALVYAVDRVIMVRAYEVRITELALEDLSAVSYLRWSGPLSLLAARPSTDAERLDSIQLALASFDLPTRPSRWVRFESLRDQFLERSRPFDDVRASQSHSRQLVKGRLFTRYLLLEGVKGEWVFAVDDQVHTYAPMKSHRLD